MVTGAGQPEILRAAQRDDVFQKRLKDDASHLVSSFFGIHRWIRCRDSIEAGSKFIYQSLTTLGNLQTLGEEYTGIVHWSAAQKLPSKQVQLVMVLLDCFGERLVLLLVTRFEQVLKDLPCDHPMRPEARATLLKACETFRKLLPFIIRLHQAVFYFQGSFYNISKRITGIQYALVRYWLRDRSVQTTFSALGLISLLHLAVTSVATLRQAPEQPPVERRLSQAESSPAKCSLCLNARLNTSCTPCGHLFCWDCIVPWVLQQPVCPICRQTVQPSRVVLLHNYAPLQQQ